jgi:Rrf2 family protein
MTLGKKSEYGLKALYYLAFVKVGERASVSELGSKLQVPHRFLEQILLKLKRAGILISQRGIEGGYRLARNPDEISLLDVLRILDEKHFGVAHRKNADVDPPTRFINNVFGKIETMLADTTLADLLDQPLKQMLDRERNRSFIYQI